MKKCLWFLMLITLLGLPAGAMAGAPGEGTSETLDEMVVTASRTKETKREISASMTVITQEEIKQSTARDLGELLFKTGNVWIRQYPGALTPASVRGFRTETHGNDLLGKVLVLLNGRRAGTGNLAKINTQNIERVEILRGPASVQYGSAGMGGIINVVTKRGKKKAEAFVEAGFGTNDRKEARFGASGKANGFDISGAFSYSKSDDYETADGDTYTNTGIDSEKSGSINMGYNFDASNRLGLVFNFYNGNEIGDPGGFTSAYGDEDNYKDSANNSVDFIYEGATGNGDFSWMARYFTGEDQEKWVTVDPYWPSTYEIETDQQGAQAQVTWDNGPLTLTGGLDWLDYDYDTSGTPSHSSYENMAGLLMAKLALMERRLIFNGGIRYDDYDVEIGNNEGGSQSTDNVAGNLGVAFQATDAIKLRLAWGQGFVMPGASQLAGSYTSWGSTYVGNPDLDPESSETFEGGVDVTVGAFTASVTYFHTDYEDFIQSTPTDTTNTYTYLNIDEGTIDGFEWELAFDMGLHFGWDYMVKPYFKGTFFTTYEDDNTGADLQYIPESTINYGLTVGRPGTFTANLNVAYYGEENVRDWNTYSDVEKSGETVVDISASYTIVKTRSTGNVSLKAEILNLFDENIEYVLDFPQAGRTYFFGIRWDY